MPLCTVAVYVVHRVKSWAIATTKRAGQIIWHMQCNRMDQPKKIKSLAHSYQGKKVPDRLILIHCANSYEVMHDKYLFRENISLK